MTLNSVIALILRYFTEFVYDVVKQLYIGFKIYLILMTILYDLRNYSAIIWAKQS